MLGKIKALTFIALLAPCVLGICYDPDGTATNDSPCYGGTEASFCCGLGWACLSNKICMSTDKVANRQNISPYYRGTCTDQTWRSGNCPNFCVDPAHNDVLDGGQAMGLCSGTSNLFYCDDAIVNKVNCASKEWIVVDTPETPTAITTIGYGSTTATQSSSTVTSAAETTDSTTSDGSTATSVRSKKTSSPRSSPTSAPTSPSSSSSTPTGTIAGATVGGVVGLAALAVLAFWLFRRNKAGSHHGEPMAASFSQPHEASGQHALKYEAYSYDALPAELQGQAFAPELPGHTPVVTQGGQRAW